MRGYKLQHDLMKLFMKSKWKKTEIQEKYPLHQAHLCGVFTGICFLITTPLKTIYFVKKEIIYDSKKLDVYPPVCPFEV